MSATKRDLQEIEAEATRGLALVACLLLALVFLTGVAVGATLSLLLCWQVWM